VFEDPVRDGVMIKRCMGTPGDTIRIVNGIVYINNRLHRENKDLLLYSRVSVGNRQNAIKALDSLGINNPSFFSPAPGTDHLSLHLTLAETERVSRLPGVTSVAIEKERPDTAWRVYPRHDSFKWNIDTYGPIVMPSKGMRMELTAETWILYGRLINLFENADIQHDRGQFFMEGNQVTEYTFEKDYYFMMGDNRHDSRDSRYYGPVPGDKIICKATLILFSKNKSTPRFSRIFKKLR
jgi:signal peptidase I